METNKPFIVITSVITAILLTVTIVAMVQGHDAPHPEANAITQEFIEDYTRWKMWDTLGSITFVWTFISGLFIVAAVAYGVVDTGNEITDLIIRLVLYILIIIFGLWIQPASIFDVYNMATKTPRVQTAYLSNMYYKNDIAEYFPHRHRHSNHKPHKHYFFVYSNGAREEVPEYNYNKHSTGERFYLIMCDRTVVGRFDPNIYSENI